MMNYDLQKDALPDFNLDRAVINGGIPESMIMAKYEETDIDETDDNYTDYVRGEIVDYRSDKSLFEHEESRGGVNKNSGRLQAQYYGHRGNVDLAEIYRPEIFDGFMGPEDRDPRGINTDPDMKLMRKQHEARSRFIRFTPDADLATTGGNRSTTQMMRDQQQMNAMAKTRLKVFSRELLGRDNALSAPHSHKSRIPKQLVAKCYGDGLEGEDIGKQRKATIIAREIMRNTQTWRDETNDRDFACARYTHVRKGCKQRGTDILTGVSDQRSTERVEDSSICFKTAGLLMSNIIDGKRKLMDANSTDADFDKSQDTISRKLAPFVRDLTAVVQGTTQEVRYGNSDETQSGKYLTPQMINNHLGSASHSTPSHHLINAEVIYRTVKPGADRSKIQGKIVSDVRAVYVTDITQRGKSAKNMLVVGAKQHTTEDADRDESRYTCAYKGRSGANDRANRYNAQMMKHYDSDNTQRRATNHVLQKVESQELTLAGMSYGDNHYKERLGGSIGSKYMVGKDVRDERRDDMSEMN